MKLSARHRLSRRDLVRQLGAAALALPMLELFAHQVRAEERKSRYAVFIYTPDGVNQRAFWPTESATDLTLSPILAPFAPFKDKLLVLGPQFNGADPVLNTGLTYAIVPPQHQAPVCLAATTVRLPLRDQRTADNRIGSPSIDQVIARAVTKDQPFSSLNFGIHPIGGDTPSDLNYGQDGIPLRRMDNADEAWNRVFRGLVSEPSSDTGRGLAKHSAVSDFLHARFATLSTNVSASDSKVLDQHLAALRALEERRLSALRAADGGGSCAHPPAPQLSKDEAYVRTGADTEQLSPFFMESIAAAFACNLTKVASVTFGYPGGGGEGGLRMPWLKFTDAMHSLSHHGRRPEKLERYARMHTWIASQIALLMTRLADTPTVDGTLLDHTTIYWFNRHGDGDTHSNYALPNVLLGGTGGYFNMGRMLKLPRTSPTKVLISIAHAMGVEVASFGVGGHEASEGLAELRTSMP